MSSDDPNDDWTFEDEDDLLGLTPEPAVEEEFLGLTPGSARSLDSSSTPFWEPSYELASEPSPPPPAEPRPQAASPVPTYPTPSDAPSAPTSIFTPKSHAPSALTSVFTPEPNAVARDFWEELMVAPTTVLQNQGWLTIAMYTGWTSGVLLMWVLGFLVFPLRMLVITPFVMFFAFGVPLAYMMQVTQHAAFGGEGLPSFTDADSVVFWIMGAFFRSAVLLFLCYAPAIFLASTGHTGSALIASIIGSFYFPMGWMCMCIEGRAMAAMPNVVIPSIIELFVPHLVLFGIVQVFGAISGAVIVKVDTASMETLPLLCFMAAINIYIGYVWAFLVGRVYCHYEYLENVSTSQRGSSEGAPTEDFAITAAILLVAMVIGSGLFAYAPKRIVSDQQLIDTSALAPDVPEESFSMPDPALDRGIEIYAYGCVKCHAPTSDKAPSAPKIGEFPFRGGDESLKALVDEAEDGCYDASTGLSKEHQHPRSDLVLAVRYMIIASTPDEE